MSFAKQVRDWTFKVESRANKTMQLTAQELSNRAVDRTPVSTGTLMGRWEPSIGTPQTNNYIGGEPAWYRCAGSQTGWCKDESIADVNEDDAQMYIKPKIASTASQLKIDDTYYLTNDTPHARQAEYAGWSMVAPYRMMGTAVAEFRQIVALSVQAAKRIK